MEAVARNTQTITAFMGSQACRAVLLGRLPDAEESKVEAWVDAHCHLTKAGAKQVCSEQITFLAHRASSATLANLVFGCLDSDLPLALWWQGEFPHDMDPSLVSRVDRLIFDSDAWVHPRAQFAMLENLAPGSRPVRCDLAWTRTLHLRQAIAQMFDPAEIAPLVRQLDQVTITHAKGSTVSATLLLCWLASQLQWRLESVPRGQVAFTRSDGGTVSATLTPIEEGAAISKVTLRMGGNMVELTHRAGERFLTAVSRLADGKEFPAVFVADVWDEAELLACEIADGSLHKVYRKAMGIAVGVLA
jgi:glucose-6-phosphate dehydrogenase assembly protein OpcA